MYTKYALSITRKYKLTYLPIYKDKHLQLIYKQCICSPARLIT